VVQSASGGVLALRGERDAALDSAHAQMSDHCTGYQIVREGEEVIGHDTIAGAHPVTAVATEWRVYYQCALP
jgi:hypothetical protein